MFKKPDKVNLGFSSELKTLYFEKPLNHKVMVDVFIDMRPNEEKDGSVRLIGIDRYSRDSQFKIDMPLQVAKAVIRYFKVTGLFNSVKLYTAEEKSDADIIITGKLTHLYGYLSSEYNIWSGILLDSLKTVGAKVEYDIQIFDKNDTLLWEGKIDGSFNRKVKFYEGVGNYARQGVKYANTNLAQKLKEILREGYRK